MPSSRIGLALTLGMLAAPAAATDLTKIPRKIAKEPAYETRTPRYCLLVFGPEAKARAWLVLDGNIAYLDRNGNGDLTEADEKIRLPTFNKMERGGMEKERQHSLGNVMAWKDHPLQVTLMQVQMQKGYKPRSSEEAQMMKLLGNPPGGLVTGIIVADQPKGARKDPIGPINAQTVGADRNGALCLSDSAREAPIVHFHGPLQMNLHPVQSLVRGQESELKACVGTPGLGIGTFVSVLYFGLIPEDAHPIAEIVFPPGKLGTATKKMTVTLTKRC